MGANFAGVNARAWNVPLPSAENIDQLGGVPAQLTGNDAEIAPGRVPVGTYVQIPMVSKGGAVNLEVATESGSVADVWDHKDNVWQGRTHAYKPGDVIMTYGTAINEGNPIVDQQGNGLLDRAVGDPKIIARTYKPMDESRYLNRGTNEAPELDIAPGAHVTGVKRAPITLLLGVPEGTLVATLETERAGKPPIALSAGSVVVLGLDGEPYVQPLKNVLTRNVAAPGNPDAERAVALLKSELGIA